MKKRYARVLLAAGLLFLALFAARFAAELGRDREPAMPFPAMGLSSYDQENAPQVARKNYASEKIQVGPSASQQVDQKYERVAELAATSPAFDADTEKIRAIAAGAKAVIQRENAWGLAGNRSLSLSLGLLPEAFDPAVAALRGVGKLVSATVTKADRTGEFLALEARRLSLEKTRDGLRALRTTGASLADLVDLETRILEIEGQIQELGVSLGDFSESNSFCTVNLSLAEARPAASAGRLLAAAVDALGWALLVELGIALAALAATGAAALGAWAWERVAVRLAGKKEGESS